MRAGLLRHRVEIEARSATPDTYGEPAQTWTPVASSVPAAIDPLSGRELLQAQALQPEVTHRVTIRYASGIEAEHRIVFGTRIFDVKVVRNVAERGIELELLCTEGRSAG